MKTIMCYGDSNTCGCIPLTGAQPPRRYAPAQRWPEVLRRELGDGHWIVEEGLNSRTTVWDDPLESFRSGKDFLVPCLRTHQPIDLVIVMLGTNDLKGRFKVGARDIAAGAGLLLDIVRASDCGPGESPPQALLVCAEKGYDSHANRVWLRRRGIRPRIARRGVESSARLGRHRWRVPRSLSWLSCWRRLQVRWDEIRAGGSRSCC